MSLWLRRAGVKLGAVVFSPLNLLPLAPQGRAVARAALFVTQVLPLPMKPQEWLSPDTVREAVTFPLSSEEGAADIYRIPDGKKHAGVLVFLGINPAPRDDHRVVNLGKGLARAGFVAMFPWSTSMMGKRIAPTEPDNLVRAFEHLSGLEYVDPQRVGMGGFCVGASMLTVAASDPRISEKVSFISSFGAYYDMWDMVKQISANRSFYRQVMEPWDPNHLSEEVLANQLVAGLGDEKERETMARTFIEKDATESPALDGLSTGGKAVYRLLSSMTASEEDRLTLDEADKLMQDLPPNLLEELKSISPITNISNLKARVLIAHDREDDLVPSEESRRLADALSDRGDFHHTEFSFFSHVTPNKRVGPFTFVKETLNLFRYTYSIIRVAI